MKKTSATDSRQQWSRRIRIYGAALLVTACVITIGLFGFRPQFLNKIDIPVIGILLLLLGAVAAEAYLHATRVQERAVEADTTHVREKELAEHLAHHHQTIFNEISRLLINRLDVNELPAEVLERIAQLTEADLIIVWVTSRTNPGQSTMKGVFGLSNLTQQQAEALRLPVPPFALTATGYEPIILEDARRETSATLRRFCETENVASFYLAPIICRNELVGGIGAFYRKKLTVTPSLTTEIQTLTNLIASAIQAEELYRNLVHAQKVESIGSLASGIAHDFNNVLAAILASANYIKLHTDPSSPTYRYLEATEASAHRGAALTKQLLTFARGEGPRVTALDVNACIEDTLKILERSFEKTILVQRQLAPDLRPIEIDPSQLQQIILNISVNARDAMPTGGIFTIQTQNKQLDLTDPHRPKVGLPDGSYVSLSLRDTGTGMPPEVQQHIFDPFFTTKGPGKGTGLGLSVVINIIRNFGGDLRVESTPGKGTLFEVFFPATNKPLPKPDVAPQPVARGGGECILIAEDEEVIREMAKLGLEEKGYTVLTAADGAAALSLYRQEWQRIDLAVLDMVMPRISGYELMAGMRQINPDVRVIVSSGYSHDLEGKRMLEHGCLAYLQKPYNTDQLCQIIRNVLDSGL